MTQKLIKSINSPQGELINKKHPYKITIIHPSAGVNWSGGSEIFAIEITRRLSNYFEVELLSGADCGEFSRLSGGIPRAYTYDFINQPLIKNLVHRFANHPEIIIEHLTNFFPCVTRCLFNSPDLIFPCNDYGGLAIAAAVRAIKGTPILYVEHNSLLAEGKCLKRNLFFSPDNLVVYDEKTAGFVRNIKPTQTVKIIPNGVDLKQFTPQGNKIDFGLNKPVILCVASLNRNNHKRVDLAINAVSRLSEASLLLCGDGPDKNYFQARGDKLLGSNRFKICTFPFQKMPEVYRSADIFTLPSLNEPFGFAYIEAMSSGLPVVATDDEMRRYIVGDSGILCDVTNPEIYADALSQVLKIFKENWQEKAINNALRFSWDAIALKYRDVILELIKNRLKVKG
ncbi:glycosyltransferase [Plectonema cf. radiosum LEGE 06105]|uniref:Glycosyltransferase n=1 Tax=Plectonema cf. radiosum LEGE 06105 TaxID=945769 RepID=A0A8J7F434_9CYAN|nr:glycosyltransferase [Plectonema radiosum]MBE9214635.1 glycosyltransferase [Plectonema cf. radiosum LEGE 06105]